MKKLLLAGAGLSMSLSALAYNFANEDALFARRNVGFAEATAARAAYAAAVESGNLNQDEKVYAVSQVGRLDLFRASMIPGVPDQTKRDVTDGCLNFVYDQIRDTNSQQYYYHYIACVALRGKLATGIIERGRYGIYLKNVEAAALASTTVDGVLKGGYEAGGILRVIAAVRGNRKAKVLGLYNPEQGVEYASAALESASAYYPPFTSAYNGKTYFENQFYLANARINLAIEKEDKASIDETYAFVDATIKRVAVLEERGRLPEERKPERDYYMGELKAIKGMIEQCNADQRWSKCLADAME